MHVIIEMTGTTPLLMHNDRLSDPGDEIVKAIALITGKRKKTDDDHAQVARLEWFGGIYADADGPFVPARNVRKALIEAAKVRRLGTAVERAVIMRDVQFPLVYDGPRDLEALWAIPRFGYRTPVGLGSGQSKRRVPRMRPQFTEWQIAADVELLTDVLDFDDLVETANACGLMQGLGDGRSIGFGRFSAIVKQV